MIQRFIAVGFLFIAFSNSSLAADTQSKNLEKMDTLIANNELKTVLPMIEKQLSTSPKDLELLMRKSRVITLQGDQAKDDATKVKYYDKGQEVADRMIDIDPESAKGYLRRAVAKGKLILFKGALESRSLVLELKSDTEKVLDLKSTNSYEKALAHYLLGRAHLKLSRTPKAVRLPLGLAWANKAQGAKHLKTAAELSPQSIPFNLDYATWLNDNGNKEEAKKILTKIATLDIYDPADTEHKETAKKMLNEI